MEQLLFVTTSSLAANPRLVKEFETLKTEFDCFVLCFKHHDWSLEPSEAIKTRNPEIQFIEVDRKKSILQTLASKILHSIAKLLNPLFKKSTLVSALASNDKTAQLLIQMFKISGITQLKIVIAHNLGAFYPAMRIANATSPGLQLDVEDFYPGEALYFNKGYEKTNRLQIMQAAFSKATTITYASEGIALECQKQFEIGADVQQATILNVFLKEEFKAPTTTNLKPITCVWFSQHIGPSRGLEQLFEAAKRLSHVEFHLIGNLKQDFLDSWELGNNFKFHQSMPMQDLHGFLSEMDIGLALENLETDHNRNICLTNKILAYAQAGLYIVATDTFGQRQFLEALEYKAGNIIKYSLEESLQHLDMDLLGLNAKTERWQQAKSYAWDNEQVKLKALLS